MLDNVTINQLRAFVAVCDEGSFSGAARELNRAQSAISHAIKALESAFDVELFERNTREATLTSAGRSLLPDARAVISRTEEMKTRAMSIAEAGVPQVSIAVDTYFSRAHLIECLAGLQTDFSTVQSICASRPCRAVRVWFSVSGQPSVTASSSAAAAERSIVARNV